MAHEPEAERARAMKRLEAFAASVRRTETDLSGTLGPATADLFAAFAAADIRVLLLKGAALEALLYRPGERRPYVDIDLLAAPGQIRDVEGILQRLGYHNASESLGVIDVGGVVHAETWLRRTGTGGSEVLVELHRWLPGARPDAEAWEALWRGRTQIEISGQAVPVLDRPGQALGLATHVAQHGPSFVKGLAELSLALDHWPHDVWEDATRLADEVGALEPFSAGLRLLPEGAALADRLGLPESDWERWQPRPRGAGHVGAFEAAGLRERLGLLRRALFPNRRWITSEYHWARRSVLLLPFAYLRHIARAPLWAARAMRFRRRARRRAEL